MPNASLRELTSKQRLKLIYEINACVVEKMDIHNVEDWLGYIDRSPGMLQCGTGQHKGEHCPCRIVDIVDMSGGKGNW